MTRIIAIGDCHFGSGRNADCYAALDQILDAEMTPAPAAWVQLGDLFHTRSTIEDRNALATRIFRMASVAPVVILKGNHDAAGDLLIFGRLHTVWPVVVVERPEVVSVRFATDQMAAIACLPYPIKAGLIAAGTTADVTLDAARDALMAICRGLAAELETARRDGALPLFAAHLNIGGAVSSVGQPMIGREIEMDPAMLDLFGDVPKMLGHIHKPQEIHGAYYAGSIAPMDWGEMEAKRYLVITYGPHGWGGHAGDGPWASAGPDWDYDLRSCELAVPRMIHVEGELTREGFEWHEPGTDSGVYERMGPRQVLKAARFANVDVRVRYRFHPAERDMLDESLVRAPFAGARTLKVEPIPIVDRAVRAPEVIAAGTVEDQVRAYAAEQGIAVTEGLMAKLATVQGGEL